MRSVGYNLGLLECMLEDFEAYILSSVVFWPLAQESQSKLSTPLPRLTLGGLSLTLDELASQRSAMNREQEFQYLKLMKAYERLGAQWQVAIEKKAQKELNSRLNLWKAYAKDLEDEPNQIEAYAQEVRIRVMIHHLVELCGPSHQSKDKLQILQAIDDQIETYLHPEGFLWEEALREIYPPEKYPFLYRSPR